jgi:aspartate aminotransferase
VVNSFSKNFSMTGWRIGWLFTTDEDVVTELGKANRATTACPNAVSQAAARGALADHETYISSMQQEYRERRDATMELLEELGLEATQPDGSIYVFPDIGTNGWDAARSLLNDAGVGVVPGTPSGPSSDTNIRICFGSTSMERLEEGLDRIRDWADQHR